MTQARQVIAEVMQEVQGLAKRDRNQAQGFNFRGIDAVMNAVGPALRKAGGFIVPQVLERVDTVGQTAKGSQINICHLTVQYSVYGKDGDPIIGTASAEAFDSGDKATAKAMSVAYRTFLLQLLALPTDEPDPDSFSYDATTVKPKARDWSAEITALTNVEAARHLYNEARTQKAGAKVLDAIKVKADSFAPTAV